MTLIEFLGENSNPTEAEVRNLIAEMGRILASMATGTAAESGKTVHIIASVPPTDHGWLGAISKNAKKAAGQHKDVKFVLL